MTALIAAIAFVAGIGWLGSIAALLRRDTRVRLDESEVDRIRAGFGTPMLAITAGPVPRAVPPQWRARRMAGR